MSYPEHEKLRALGDKSQTCGEFIEWLRDTKGIVLAETHEHSWECSEEGIRICGFSTSAYLQPVHTPIRSLLAEFFGIDVSKLEEEKEGMLEEIRTGRPKVETL